MEIIKRSDKEMMEEALEYYGPRDLLTIMLSQRVDGKIVEEYYFQVFL